MLKLSYDIYLLKSIDKDLSVIDEISIMLSVRFDNIICFWAISACFCSIKPFDDICSFNKFESTPITSSTFILSLINIVYLSFWYSI